MISNKQLWQSIYHIIKYSDYELAYINEDETDIILQNKSKKELIRFVSEKQSVQSLNFLIDKMKDNMDVFNQQLNYTPQRIRLLLVNQETHGELHDELVKVNSIERKKDLDQLPISFPYKIAADRLKPKAENTYRNKVIKNNFIDRAMIKFAPATFTLIIMNIIVYLVTMLSGHGVSGSRLVDQGGLTHFNFIHGDYFRLVTSMFLHFDFSHLLFNMMALYIFGKIIEYLYGSFRYLIIYLSAGLLGNLISLSFDTTSLSAGASGAISGLLGALIAYFIFSGKFDRKFIIQSVLGMIIFLLISNVFAQVNNLAHFGGLFGGFLAALLTYSYQIKRKYFYLLLIGTGLILVLLLMNIFSVEENHIYNNQAEQSMAQGDFNEAENILKSTLEHGYENDETYILYGLVKAHDSSVSDAMDIWKKGLKQFPESAPLNYQMALAMRAADNYNKAASYLDKAMAIDARPAYKKLRTEIEVFEK